VSELRPYQAQRSVPLSAGARFIRGFKRIGIAAGVIVLLLGVAITIGIALEQQSQPERKFKQATCIAGLVRDMRPLQTYSYDRTIVDYEKSGCAGYSFYGDALEVALAYAKTSPPAPLEHAVQPFFIGTAISLACGAAVFVGFWAIGWLCAGFTRD
jgi:hypothetical protein